MAGRRLPVCIVCDRKFRPDRYNEHRQKCCPRQECRSALERARKRKYYRERMEREKEFREKERQRCAEAMRRARAAKAAAKEASGAEPARTASSPPVEAVLAGLISQLADTTDPHAVAVFMGACADRGRRLAVGNGGQGFG